MSGNVVQIRDFERGASRKHLSDCAVYNEPALPKGECDCGGIPDDLTMACADPEMVYEAPDGDCA